MTTRAGPERATLVPLVQVPLTALALNPPPVVRALRATTPPTEVAR